MDKTHTGWQRAGFACEPGTEEATHWIWASWADNAYWLFNVTRAGLAPPPICSAYLTPEAAAKSRKLEVLEVKS